MISKSVDCISSSSLAGPCMKIPCVMITFLKPSNMGHLFPHYFFLFQWVIKFIFYLFIHHVVSSIYIGSLQLLYSLLAGFNLEHTLLGVHYVRQAGTQPPPFESEVDYSFEFEHGTLFSLFTFSYRICFSHHIIFHLTFSLDPLPICYIWDFLIEIRQKLFSFSNSTDICFFYFPECTS